LKMPMPFMTDAWSLFSRYNSVSQVLCSFFWRAPLRGVKEQGPLLANPGPKSGED
jgi:hypothetical protein